MEVEGSKRSGRLTESWWDDVEVDVKRFDLSSEDTQCRNNGEVKLWSHLANEVQLKDDS